MYSIPLSPANGNGMKKKKCFGLHILTMQFSIFDTTSFLASVKVPHTLPSPLSTVSLPIQTSEQIAERP